LFIGRALDGITGGNQAVAQAAIGDVSTHENRAKNFGLIGAAFGLGFILGPYIGGRLSGPDKSFYGLFNTPDWFSATTPFWFAAILSLFNCGLILGLFPETLQQKVNNGRLQFGRAVSNVVDGFRSDRLRVVLGSAFLFNAGFTFFTTFFGVYLRNNFGFDEGKTGDYFAIVGLFIAVSQAVLVARVARSLPDWKVLRFSLFGTGLVMFVYFFSPTDTTLYLYLTIPFFTFFNGLSMANMGSLVSRSAEMGRQGEAMGIYSSVQSLAQVPASVLVGYIATSITSATPLIVSGSCIAAGGLLFLLAFRPKYVNDALAVPGAVPVH
jgi:DHA1 family tetracycline resistance protein-like MFS transporter